MSQHLPPRRQNWKPIKTRDGPHRAKKCRLRWGAIDGERKLQQLAPFYHTPVPLQARGEKSKDGQPTQAGHSWALRSSL
jgi:hypothetical protein